MKVLVFSDSHGYLKNAEAVLNRIGGKMEAVLHLGDHDTDAEALSRKYTKLPFYYVQGNNDYSHTPLALIVRLCGKKLLLTHGHRQQVYWDTSKLSYFGQEQEADIVLFGHTHVPFYDDSEAMSLFNPGSISMPRNTEFPTFGILDISDAGVITASVMEFQGEKEFVRMDRLP